MALPDATASAPALEKNQIPRPQNEAPPQAEEAVSSRKAWTKPVGLAVLAVVLVIAAIYGYRAWQFGSTHVTTDDAYVTNDVVQITPQVSGNVSQVLVRENEAVKAGQTLVILDDATYRTAVDQARAALAAAEAAANSAASSVDVVTQTGSAQIEQATGALEGAQEAIGGAQSEVLKAQAGIGNAQAGVAGARANVKTAEAGVTAAQVMRQRALASVEGARAQIATAEAAVKGANANVSAAQANAEKSASDLQRYTQLFAQSAVSAQQVDVARAADTSAKAQLDAARDGVAQAKAVLDQRRADLKVAQETVTNAEAQIAQARAQLAAVRQSVNAALSLQGQAEAQLQTAKKSVAQAVARKSQTQGQVTQAQAAPRQVAVSEANRQTARAHVLEARAALEAALLNLKRTRLTAPMEGVISRKTVEIGQQLSIGQNIMAVVPRGNAWVVANLKETQTRALHPGQPVEVEVDALSGQKLTGKVDSISAGTGATFALLPADNATGNFTKVVQRIPVKIVLDPGQPNLDRLQAGLSAVVAIRIK